MTPQSSLLPWLALFTSILCLRAHAQDASLGNPPNSAETVVLQETAPVITEEGRSYRVWTRTVTKQNRRTGEVLTENRSYVELGSGLNYRDHTGQWQASREEFAATADGRFVAERGPHKLRLGRNLNALPPVELVTEDGLVLGSAPLAVGYFDRVSGNSVILAQVKDAAPRQTAPNEVVYGDALDNLAGAFRYTYRRNGMSQDLILLEAPPDPATLGLSEETRLEVYTEWTGDVPEPVRTAQPIYTETDPLARAAKAEPDFQDEMLQFGADTRIVRGRAFSLPEAGEAIDQIPVGKQFGRIDGRPILVESVEYRALKPLFRGLKQAALPQNKEGQGLLASTRSAALAMARARRPGAEDATKIALASFPTHGVVGVVIDYQTVCGSFSTFTFETLKTYFISCGVDITSSATLQQDAFLKFANSAYLRLSGSLTCPAAGEKPAILTSKDDDISEFGEWIADSTGNPTYMADPAIGPYFTSWGMTIRNLRFRWAKSGVEAAGSSSVTHTISDCIFEQSQRGMLNNMSAGSISLGSNVKQCGVTTAVSGTGTTTGTMTIDCGVANASQFEGHQVESGGRGQSFQPAANCDCEYGSQC